MNEERRIYTTPESLLKEERRQANREDDIRFWTTPALITEHDLLLCVEHAGEATCFMPEGV